MSFGGFSEDSLIVLKLILPPTGKKWCKTKNSADSISNLGNGKVQMPFWGKLDIYGVKN